jgi:hypothetical protein
VHQVYLNTVTASGKLLNQTYVNDVLTDYQSVAQSGTHVKNPFPLLRPSCLHILYDYDYQDHPWGTQFDHSNVLKQIRRRYRSVSRLSFFANDVMCALRTDNWQTLPEFEFFRQLQDEMPKTPCEFYHSQNFPHTVWADHYLYTWIGKFTQFQNSPLSKSICIPDCNFSSAVKALSCLNGAGRPHRIIFAILLTDTDCVLRYHCLLNTDYAWSMMGFKLAEMSPKLRNQYEKNLPLARQKFRANRLYSNQIVKRDFNLTLEGIRESIQLIQQGFCHVITDDPFNSSWPRITEKTLKPMIARRPFLMLGAQGNLAWLRSKGFRTFSQWWDESYDQQSDKDRLESVYIITRYINSLSMKQRQDLLNQMQPVLDHNLEHLKVFEKLTYNNVKSG